MENNIDFQEQYNNSSTGNLEKKIPLAADAAHLLADYLDAITIEFVRKGVIEPYTRTSEIEEIILHELEVKGSSTKMTYDFVKQHLESWGTPQQVVTRQIEKHDLLVKHFLVQPDLTNQPSTRIPYPVNSGNLSIPLFKIMLYSIFSLMIGTELFFIIWTVLSFSPPQPDLVYMLYLPAVGISIFELISARTGTTFINVDKYRAVRSIIINLLLIAGILIFIIFWDTLTGDDRGYVTFIFMDGYLVNGILPFIIAYTTTLIRDHLPKLYPLTPQFKPFLRFLTKPYLFLWLSILCALLMFYNNPSTHQFAEIFAISALIFSLVSVAVGNKGQYVVSKWKLIFTTLIPVAVVERSIVHISSLFYSDLIDSVYPALVFLSLLWYIVYAMLVIKIYWKDLKRLLSGFRSNIEIH